MTQPNPEFRERVHRLAESQWGESAVVIHLGDVGPGYTVPGRRKDGTVKGKRLIRRFFWNIFRGTFGGAVNIVLSVAAGEPGNLFARDGHVTGPADAKALGLADAARRATTAWLVYSPSHVAVADTGHSFYDPADSPPVTFRWHETGADAPRITPRKHLITWPDGSTFRFVVDHEESRLLKESPPRP